MHFAWLNNINKERRMVRFVSVYISVIHGVCCWNFLTLFLFFDLQRFSIQHHSHDIYVGHARVSGHDDTSYAQNIQHQSCDPSCAFRFHPGEFKESCFEEVSYPQPNMGICTVHAVTWVQTKIVPWEWHGSLFKTVGVMDVFCNLCCLQIGVNHTWYWTSYIWPRGQNIRNMLSHCSGQCLSIKQALLAILHTSLYGCCVPLAMSSAFCHLWLEEARQVCAKLSGGYMTLAGK